MVEEQRKREANTFLNKKGRVYVIQFASLEEKRYFDGILYDNGIPIIAIINQISSFSIPLVGS